MPPSSVPPADLILGETPRAASLLDAVDRLLNVGAVAAGEATISIAGVDLIYLGLNLVLSSVETLQASAGGPDAAGRASGGGKPGPAGADQSGPSGPRPGLSTPVPGPADTATHPPGSERASEGRPPVNERAHMTKPAEAGCDGRGDHTALANDDARAGADAALIAPESPPTPAAPFTGLCPVSPLVYGRAEPSIPAAHAAPPAGPRLDLDPDQVEQGLAKLVLTLVEFLRQLLERQAIRRMDGGSLSDEEIERMGAALLQLRTKLWEMAGQFGLQPEELNLDLGPLGNLL